MIPKDEWVIQLAVRGQMTARLDVDSGQRQYVPWAGYTRPMTGDQAVQALAECEARWPGYESGHTGLTRLSAFRRAARLKTAHDRRDRG